MQIQLEGSFFGRDSQPVRVTIFMNASEAAAIRAATLVPQSERAPRQVGQRLPPAFGPGAMPAQVHEPAFD